MIPTLDKVGLGWRPEIAPSIFAHLDRIDIVEVIADDYFSASSPKISALRMLSAQVPITLHGVGLGMASTFSIDAKRLHHMARLVGRVHPESWSEHLAFVRAGGVEIGHLAAPPRTQDTVEATAEHLDRATRVVGLSPHMENIATLIDPPGSKMGEAEWLSSIFSAEPKAGLLLDLHNVYANATNFGFSAKKFLQQIPLHRVHTVHIAGGKWISGGAGAERQLRLLDDHLHPVPDPVYELLTTLAALTSQPLTVILERDGAFPRFEELLAELDMARLAIARGRSLRNSRNLVPVPVMRETEANIGRSSWVHRS